MFELMIKTFIQATLLFFPILIAFSLAFYMAFNLPGMTISPFGNHIRSIVTVLTYSLGGADYNALFALSHVEGEGSALDQLRDRLIPFPITSGILWVLFLIVMLILLVNMLVSLHD